jgi:tRNA pseudouridine38-40 synthase
LLVVAYDGTNYAGWQIQVNQPTIQSTLELALSKLCPDPVTVIGSGRTDSGVHAIGQVARCCLPSWRASPEALRAAINSHLPRDIAITGIREVPETFHPIRDCLGKRYRYQLQLGGAHDPFLYRYCWHLTQRLDLDSMRQGAALLVGRHDFAGFQATGSERKTTVRDVRELSIVVERESMAHGDFVAIEIEANGFLYNMVRNIVGTLVEVGRRKQAPEWVQRVLVSKNRMLAGPTAPAHGLLLQRVDYPD